MYSKYSKTFKDYPRNSIPYFASRTTILKKGGSLDRGNDGALRAWRTVTKLLNWQEQEDRKNEENKKPNLFGRILFRASNFSTHLPPAALFRCARSRSLHLNIFNPFPSSFNVLPPPCHHPRRVSSSLFRFAFDAFDSFALSLDCPIHRFSRDPPRVSNSLYISPWSGRPSLGPRVSASKLYTCRAGAVHSYPEHETGRRERENASIHLYLSHTNPRSRTRYKYKNGLERVSEEVVRPARYTDADEREEAKKRTSKKQKIKI